MTAPLATEERRALQFPARNVRPTPRCAPTPDASLAERLIVELASADDVYDGMTRVVPLLRSGGHLRRVEWWAPAEDGHALRLEAASGFGGGQRTAFPVGALGSLVLVGDDWDPELMEVVTRFVTVLRRRATEEQLAVHALRLIRQNEALGDFAALVAHELKGALATARLQADATSAIDDAIALVDSILEVARSESAPEQSACAARCLEEALGNLGEIEVEISADLPDEFPLPPAALRVLLRNLVANAIAAKARHIRVSASAAPHRSLLVVDDDGVGVGAPNSYAAGSGLGLGLCRRLASRLGGALELEPSATGGTCATLILTGGKT